MMKKQLTYGAAAMLLLIVSIIVSLSVGSASISLADVWSILQDYLFHSWQTDASYTDATAAIVVKVRLPRVILAVLVGAALALAGAGFQGILRNPLADPYTLGVASGSSIGAAVVILFGMQLWLGLWTIPLAAFLTGLLALITVLMLARHQGLMNIETLILSGVIVQAFLGAFVSFMISLSQGAVNEILFWIMGSLAHRSWDHALMLLPFLIIGFPILFLYRSQLNVIMLGERHAAHLGMNVERTKFIILITCTLLTAAAVSVSGVVGFVGLVIPHLLRLLVGPDYRLLLPLSAICGSTFMLWADTLARTLLSPREIPLGVITALVGAPFFAYLLIRHKKAGKQATLL
ncbi:FecCD family ABC transporter permease [Paenibacillus yanchengensis]|uniref:FecCD family ABC transporter permease n=1 Tax=Paenibacillus yanchengensis TaxID=2035833 RepID=A0ABW4YM74_9BACL